jgi:phosphoglycerate dehydrogenase-like enzyme
LTKVKPGAGLASIARGAVIDHDALREALSTGTLSGAIVDSFNSEPLPPESPIWTTSNLIVVPHCSSDDLENYIPLTLDLVFSNLSHLLARRPLKNRVDPVLGY